MAIEIERRFLVRDHRAAIAAARRAEWTDIRQGYFGHIDGLKLRVRSSCDSHGVRSALLTRKGPRRGVAAKSGKARLTSVPQNRRWRRCLWHRSFASVAIASLFAGRFGRLIVFLD